MAAGRRTAIGKVLAEIDAERERFAVFSRMLAAGVTMESAGAELERLDATRELVAKHEPPATPTRPRKASGGKKKAAPEGGK